MSERSYHGATSRSPFDLGFPEQFTHRLLMSILQSSYTAICKAVDLEKHEIVNFLLKKLNPPERDYFVKVRRYTLNN